MYLQTTEPRKGGRAFPCFGLWGKKRLKRSPGGLEDLVFVTFNLFDIIAFGH